MSIATGTVYRLGRKKTTIRVRRFDENGSYVNGRWQSGGFAEFEIVGSTQQLSADEIVAVPENAREREMLKIYTDTNLFTADDSLTKRADIVEFGGVWYEVMKCFRFTMGIQNHVKAVVARLPEQQSGHNEEGLVSPIFELPLTEGFEQWLD